VQKSALRLGVPNDLLEDDELDYLVRLHQGDKVNMNDALRLAKGRLSGMATEKVTERLIFATHWNR
jgi:hypothetical protein